MTTSTGGRELVRFLVRHGHRHVFGLPGSSMVAPIYELQNTDICFVPTIHESVTVAAADGYARVAGSAMALIYMLPGLANGLANLYNAWRDETALTLIASQQASRYRSLSATVGEGDLVSMARPFTRFAHELAPGMDIGFWLEKACTVSTGPQPGPVFLSIPEDVFEARVPPSPQRQRRTAPSPQLDASIVAERFLNAERPLIVVGGQLRRFGGSEALEELSREFGIALAYEPGFQDRLGAAPGHPNMFGNLLLLSELEQSADCVLLLGARSMIEAHPKKGWFPAAGFTAQVNADPMKLEDSFRTDWALAADPGNFAKALRDAMRAIRRNENQREARRLWLSKLTLPNPADPLVRSMGGYAAALSPLCDAMERGWLVDESVMASPLLHSVLSSSDGERYVGTTGASLGWGPGAAAGVALASGEPVTCAIGDGALRFGALGLWTVRERNLPVTTIVLDNGGYGSTRFFERNYVASLGPEARPQHPSYLGSDLRDSGSSVESIIEGFGIPTSVVERGDHARPAIERAWREAEAGEGPNAVVIRLPFGD